MRWKGNFFFTDIEWKGTYEVSLKLPLEGFISSTCKLYRIIQRNQNVEDKFNMFSMMFFSFNNTMKQLIIFLMVVKKIGVILKYGFS